MIKDTNSFTYNIMMSGLYMGIALSAGEFIFLITGKAFSDFSALYSFTTLIVAINIGIRNFRDQQLKGIISFSKGWGFAIGMSFYGAIFYAFFIYIYIRFIDQSIMDIFIDLEKEALLASGYSKNELEKFMSLRENKNLFTPYGMAIVQIFQINIYGVAIGLLASLFNHRKNALGNWISNLKSRNLPNQRK